MRKSEVEKLIKQKLEERAEEERERQADREAQQYLESRGVSSYDIWEEFGRPDYSYSFNYERGELSDSLYEWKRINRLLEKVAPF